MKCLLVLCEGLKDVNGDDLLDIRSSPFSSLKRGDIKPTADMFRDEVVRRHQLNDPNGANASPRPKSCTMGALRKWLSDIPIQEEPDIDFLTRVVEHHCHVCIAAQGLALNWNGNVPFLRLIHCVVDDSIIRRVPTLGYGPTRTDGGRESKFFCWRRKRLGKKKLHFGNDEEFEPYTLILPDIHPYEFQTSEQLTFDKVRRLFASNT
jgi:hypothetical protein